MQPLISIGLFTRRVMYLKWISALIQGCLGLSPLSKNTREPRFLVEMSINMDPLL